MNETNELNHLETRLRSWTPRRPSATLERRLFRRTVGGPRPTLVAGWLAPATACLLLAGLVLNPSVPATWPHPPPAGALAALALSNQNFAAYLPGSFQRTHNQLEAWSAGGCAALATNWMQ